MTIQRIEENVRLTHSLKSSNSLVSQMDLQIDHLNKNLEQYQYLLTQLNSLLIRSEYFEVQLKLLETEDENKNWKDNDLNWRTTEATLENLFLEFRFLSKKIECLSIPKFGNKSPFQSSPSINFNSPNIISTPNSNFKFNNDINCSSSPLHSRSLPFDQRSTFSLRSSQVYDQRSIISYKSYTKKSPILTRLSFSYLDEEDELQNEDKSFEKTVEQVKLIKNEIEKPKTEFNLKPIVCSSKPVIKPRYKRKASSEIKSLNLLKFKSNQQLPTPDSTFNDSSIISNVSTEFTSEIILDESVENIKVSPLKRVKDDDDDIIQSPTKRIHSPIKSNESSPISANDFFISPFKKTKKSHSRSHSLPYSINLDDIVNDSKKSNLRHFISHDTGLKTKIRATYKYINESDEEDIKESQFVNSPVESILGSVYKKKDNELTQKIEEAIENKMEIDNKEIDIDIMENEEVEVKVTLTKELADQLRSPTSIIKNIEDDVFIESQSKLPTFEHKLNRSNSCDSIFSTIQARNHVPPRRNNQEQTMNWMRKFASVNNSIVKETDVSAISTTSLSSRPINSSKVLHDLVSTKDEYTSLSNLIQPNNWQSIWSSKSDIAKPSLETRIISNESILPKAIPVVSKSSIIKEPTNLQQFSKQWVSLLSKFKPDNILQSQNLVTSEIGRPIKPININSNNENNISKLQYPHRSEKLKGHASTLTIGPNGSKFFNHGESSPLAQSLVLSSRVSHSALKAALCEDFLQF